MNDGELRGLIRMEMRGNTDVIANEIRSLFSVCSSQVPTQDPRHLSDKSLTAG